MCAPLRLPAVDLTAATIAACIQNSTSTRQVYADLRAELVSEFSSRNDLIAAMLTSCHIPVYFTGAIARTFRGRLACDGGLADFLPIPPGMDYAARVCCFPSQSLPALVRHTFACALRHGQLLSPLPAAPELCA
jgi:predicted acylesterase/phospholipase RssA